MKQLVTFVFSIFFSAASFAQQPIASGATNSAATGTLVSVVGVANIRANNDQAVLDFFVEEQDKEQAVAASRVNSKMKAGTELANREDPTAQLTTRGYYSYPVYADDQSANPSKPRRPQFVGWRVGQHLEARVTNLKTLSGFAAALQKNLALNGVSFGLTERTRQDLDANRIEAGFRNFHDRVRLISQAMGRSESAVTIESLDFELSDANPMHDSLMRSPKAALAQESVAETRFEPGETLLGIRVVGKVRIK